MISAKIINYYKNRKVNYKLNFLLKSQYWSKRKIKEYQFSKLKELINYSYNYVPFYKSIMNDNKIHPDDIRNFKDFEYFPILTKEIIKENITNLKASNLKTDDFISNSTGGSTGEPLHFFQDSNYELWADAARIRGWYNIADCKFGDTCAVLWGAVRDIKEDFTLPEKIRDLLLTGEVWLNAFNLSDDRKWKFYKWCKIVKPKLIRGYVTAINEFAQFMDENKLYLPSIKGIILGAETVYPHVQNYLENIFQTTSFNTYGGRELSLIGMECAHKNGLHEVSENNYVEYEPIKLEGYENAGNLIITNLNNYAMPFIRYRIGDIGIPGDVEKCPCGRGLPLIKKVIGRTTEVLEFYEGTKIAGEMFIHMMKEFPVHEYQFIQKSNTEIELKIKKHNSINDSVKRKITNTYKSYIPEKVNLKIVEVEEIEKSITGKFKFVLKDFN